jgi:AcrR family transcriptional regulator
MAVVCASEGYAAASIARVVARAGMSRKTFYEHFPNRQACFIDVLREGFERLHQILRACCREHDTSVARLQAAAWEAICLIDREPVLTRLCVVEALAAGPAALEARREALDRLAALLDPDDHRPGHPGMARVLVGVGLDRLHAQLTAPGAAVDPHELYGSIAYPLLVLVVGVDRARQLSSTPPVTSRPPGRPEPAPYGSGAARPRINRRKLQALTFLARNPGCSNGELQRELGFADPGQASRYLHLLVREGLVERPERHGRRNAWTLSDAGQRLTLVAEGS